jgi:hypothetical protein
MGYFRSPLLIDGQVDSQLFGLLTDSQVARLACWSIQTGKSVPDILSESKFVAEQVHQDSHLLRLLGLLSNCNLYGSLEPDGSCHT